MNPVHSLRSPLREAFQQNWTSLGDTEHFFRCWQHSACGTCLSEPDCSWCPFTWACVPNSHQLQFLAPAYDERICPHWAERWELRSQPFGCQVSTITTISTAVGITSTLAVILVLNIIILCCRFTIRRMGRRRAWQKQRRIEILGAEAEPLLRDNERLVITRQMNPET